MPDTSDLAAQGSRPGQEPWDTFSALCLVSLCSWYQSSCSCSLSTCAPGAFQAVWNSLCCVGMFPAFGKMFLHSPVLSCSTKCSLPISWRVWVSSPRMCCGQDWCSLTLGSRSCALSWAFGYFWELFSQIKGVSS